MAPIILGLALILAVAAVAFRLFSPGNPVTPYMIPRFLARRSQPKTVVRQAGVAWIVFSTWLTAIVMTLISVLPKHSLDAHPYLIGLPMFVVFLTAPMLHIAGWYFLIVGTFSRKQQIQLALRSYFEIEPELLDRDIHRLGRCTTINLTSLFLVIALPVTEAALKVEPEPAVVLVNVAFLITFIFSMRRIQYYLTRSVRAMASIEDKPFPTTNLLSQHWIFMWRDSFRVRTFYESTWRLRHATPTPQGQKFTSQGV